MSNKTKLAVVVLGDDCSKIAFGNHVAIYDLGGKLKSVVNPSRDLDFPKQLYVLDFRNGQKHNITTRDIPPGLFL